MQGPCRPKGTRPVSRGQDPANKIRVKRIYEHPEPDDGVRVLVDRVWPRGVTRQRAAVDEWRHDVAPSRELRVWFGHDPARFAEFAHRYRRELEGNPEVDTLAEVARRSAALTLLYSAADIDHNQAVVLAALLADKLRQDRQDALDQHRP